MTGDEFGNPRDYERAVQLQSYVLLGWVAILVATGLWLVFALQATQTTSECVLFAPPGEAPPPGSCYRARGEQHIVYRDDLTRR
jgi:hypothetical protein